MNPTQETFRDFALKMGAAGATQAGIRAFEHSYRKLLQGETGLIPEGTIQPVAALPSLNELDVKADPALLAQAVVVKLNGGLGTSMGLERAKSLLPVKDGLAFLDFLVRQVIYLRRQYNAPVPFLLMNSFSTSTDTLQYLKKYPELGDPQALELMQSQVPKVDATTLRPAAWPANPQLEWCPPGHGDIYPSLIGSGWLDRLQRMGVNYLFVSNSDNLGASLDLRLLTWFAQSGKPFLMEVAERTDSDRKGGHLAKRGGRLLLRESAQCPEADLGSFQDIRRHRFFNTNNLWLRLDALASLLKEHHGFVPLPLIKNRKTLDPRDAKSPPVYQLETAMGAAIECFPDSGALLVPRSRFAPVKTTSDLLALRSDAYRVAEDWRIAPASDGPPPTIDLDVAHYKLVEQLDASLAEGVPSLKQCRELKVRGPVLFNAGVVFRGKVTITNQAGTGKPLAAGDYAERAVML